MGQKLQPRRMDSVAHWLAVTPDVRVVMDRPTTGTVVLAGRPRAGGRLGPDQPEQRLSALGETGWLGAPVLPCGSDTGS